MTPNHAVSSETMDASAVLHVSISRHLRFVVVAVVALYAWHLAPACPAAADPSVMLHRLWDGRWLPGVSLALSCRSNRSRPMFSARGPTSRASGLCLCARLSRPSSLAGHSHERSGTITRRVSWPRQTTVTCRWQRTQPGSRRSRPRVRRICWATKLPSSALAASSSYRAPRRRRHGQRSPKLKSYHV
jgi:hypothetical protein